MKDKITIFWFRRDLRFDDNTGLYEALSADQPVLPLFIFDTNILDDLESRDDPRVSFIHQKISELNDRLKEKGSYILVKHGEPLEVWRELCKELEIAAVYTNRDYEPYALERDASVEKYLTEKEISYKEFKDQVVFEKNEIVKDDGDAYLVYTPYSKKWKSNLKPKDLEPKPSALYFDNFLQGAWQQPLSLEDLGFTPTKVEFPPDTVSDSTLQAYQNNRNIPYKEGTSKLGVHLRFGTISIRKLAAQAGELSQKFLNELIWREFFQMILWHFPRVVKENFYTKYDKLEWRNDKDEFDRWCNGTTGYPLVDAGMRELNTTGYMHNRVRMVTASFLTKHLLIDWRWGEAYFASKLLDYDLASNNGNWQWVAGTGVDAAPYFRIFNPHTQIDKFDKDHRYIEKWVPEVNSSEYPEPMVVHKEARERALEAFKKALD